MSVFVMMNRVNLCNTGHRGMLNQGLPDMVLIFREGPQAALYAYSVSCPLSSVLCLSVLCLSVEKMSRILV